MENYKSKNIKNFLRLYIKKDKTIIKFCDTEIKKQKFDQHKTPILIHFNKIYILIK